MPAARWPSLNDEAVEQDEESLFLWMRAHPYDDLVVLDADRQRAAGRSVSGFRQPRVPRHQRQQAGGREQHHKYRQIHDAFEKRVVTGCITPPLAQVCRLTIPCAI